MMKKGANQDQKNASHITIDARKFLRTINESVGAKLAFFTNKVADMGKKVGKNFRLVALDKRHLFYEDIDSNTYFRANINKEKNNYKIFDIKKVVVTEAEKGESFSQFCTDLVESLDKGDAAKAESAFNKIEYSRFRSTVVPSSGIVKTRDGNVHKVGIAESKLTEADKKALTSVIAEAIANNYNISEDGNVISAYFSDEDQIKLPATERMRRTVVARGMRNVAMEAWKKDGFQKFVKTVASHVSKHNLKEAVDVAAEFLNEYQEFSILDKNSFETIVENALFANNIFNSVLAENVQELLYKTNLKVNKDSIIESWEKTALKAQDAEWAQSVSLLKESSNFSEDYDNFLNTVLNEFKDTNTTLMALKFARNAAAKEGGMADSKTIEKLDDLISRLERTETEDRAAHEEAQELLAGISYDLLDRSENLDDFDSIPAPEVEDELVAPEGAVEDLSGEELGGDTGLDLDIGTEPGADELGADEGLDMDLGAEPSAEPGLEDAGAEVEGVEPAAEPAPEEDELTFEEKKKIVGKLKQLYENYNKNFGKILKEDGPMAMMAGVDQALEKAKKVGALAAEIEAKFMELKNELGESGLVSDTGMVDTADSGMDTSVAPESDYDMAMTADDTSIDSEYTGSDAEFEFDTGDEVDSDDKEGNEEGDDKGGDEGDEGNEGDEDDDKPVPPAPVGKEIDDEDKEDEDKEEVEEDQYKWGTRRHGQGNRSGYGRSSINPVKESIVSNTKYAMAIAEDDGNFWILDKNLNEATCVGDGSGQFDFDLTDDGSYIRAAKVWMEGVINSDELVKKYSEIAEGKKGWVKPWEAKDKSGESKADKMRARGDAEKDMGLEAKKDKKNDKEVEETHVTGMHGKSDTAEKMGEVEEGCDMAVGVEKDEEMCESVCPNCDSTDIISESVAEAKCGGCGVVGQKELFKVKSGKSDMTKKTVDEAVTDKGSSQKGMVDPKDAAYKTDKDARKWGDGSDRNKKPQVKEDDEDGAKGSKEAPKSKTQAVAKGDGMKDAKPGKSDMFKQQ